MTKNAIAETIIALTKMEEEYRSPVRCIATTRVRALLNFALVHCKQGLKTHLRASLYFGKNSFLWEFPYMGFLRKQFTQYAAYVVSELQQTLLDLMEIFLSLCCSRLTCFLCGKKVLH